MNESEEIRKLLKKAKNQIATHKIPYMKCGKDGIDFAYENIDKALALLPEPCTEPKLANFTSPCCDCTNLHLCCEKCHDYKYYSKKKPKLLGEKQEIEELKHLLWICHELILTGRATEVPDIILKKLNPNALKRRLEQPKSKTDAGELVKKLREIAKIPALMATKSSLNKAASCIERLVENNKYWDILAKGWEVDAYARREEIAELQAEIAQLKAIADLAWDIHTRDPVYIRDKYKLPNTAKSHAEELLCDKIEKLKGGTDAAAEK